jgi:hypothetical protein
MFCSIHVLYLDYAQDIPYFILSIFYEKRALILHQLNRYSY